MKIILIFCLAFLTMVVNGQAKKAYVVDTITIDDPHKAFIQIGGSLITIYFDGSKLDIVRKASVKRLINTEGVYFTALSYYSFFKPSNAYEKSPSNCDERVNYIHRGNRNIAKVTGDEKFILCLINIEYFNYEQRSVDYKFWKTSLDKGAYIKVVFPYCLE